MCRYELHAPSPFCFFCVVEKSYSFSGEKKRNHRDKVGGGKLVALWT